MIILFSDTIIPLVDTGLLSASGARTQDRRFPMTWDRLLPMYIDLLVQLRVE